MMQLQVFIKVKVYNISCTILQKIRQVMTRPEGNDQLAVLNELNDANMGFESRGGKRDHGAFHKTLVLNDLKVPHDKKPLWRMFKVAANLEQKKMKPLESQIEKHSTLKTNAFAGFHFLPNKDSCSFPKVLDTKEKISGFFPWLYIWISHFKNTLRAVFHGVHSRYIQQCFIYLTSISLKLNSLTNCYSKVSILKI